MKQTFKHHPTVKNAVKKQPGSINKEPEKDGIVKKVCGIITKENYKT